MSIITPHQILNSNFSSSFHRLLSLEMVNHSGPQLNALESCNKDHMRQHFVCCYTYTLGFAKQYGHMSRGSKNHNISETCPRNDRLLKMLFVYENRYAYLEVTRKMLLSAYRRSHREFFLKLIHMK